MPGSLSPPANMRDVLYKYNWRIGYMCIPIVLGTLAVGAVWVNHKRNRYDQFFEKMKNPEYRNLILEKAYITPERYMELTNRLRAEMAEVRAKYGRE